MAVTAPLAVTASFTTALPKVELHAHLTGSISPAHLREIWHQTSPSSTLEDPATALHPPTGDEHHSVSAFFRLFDTYIYRLVNSPATVAHATRRVLEAFHDDGVKYLELRTTPRACPATGMTPDTYVDAVVQEIERAGARREGTMSTYLLLSVDRRNTVEQAWEVVRLATKYRARGVVGIDLCGNPLVGPVGHLAPVFRWAKRWAWKITVHFAEVPASSAEEELDMLLSWRPDRLGHVIHTTRAMDDEIERLGLGVELCLSCNVLAKMLPDGGGFAEHHLGKWFGRTNAVALCTDDVGVFGSPLSHEYQLAADHFNLSREDLVQLSRGAVTSIFGGEREKIRLNGLLDEFEKDFLA